MCLECIFTFVKHFKPVHYVIFKLSYTKKISDVSLPPLLPHEIALV